MTGGARLGYVVSMFPRLSETFILNEVLELERLGYDLTIFPRKPDGGGPRHGEIDRVRSRVDPVCVTRPRDWFPTLSDHLRVFAGAPRLYLRTLQGVLRRRRWPAFRKFLVAGRVARRVRGRRLTHLHAHFAADNAKIARLAARLTGVPFSFTAHAKDIWVKTPPASLRKLLGAARFAVTICRYNREYLSRLAPRPKRLHLIYNGLDTDKFNPARKTSSIPSPAWELLAVGRLVPKKGFQLLPEVCRILNEAGLDFRLRVVGDGPLDPRLRRSVEQGRLQDRLRLEGACSQEKLIRDYLRRADILVMPCMIASDGDRDGIPTVILEAMSMGVPVVATAVAGIPEVVLDRKTGILVEPDSPQAIADGIIRLIADPELGDRLARTGRDRVRAMFDRHKNVGRLARLFEGEAA